MNVFDVLDPNTDVKKSGLIEASAGTGKTFSIENIVKRLVSEGFCVLDQILVVTFTRAATRDLRMRIRSNLVKAFEENPSQKNLRQALLMFDETTIETIHGFCSKSLREHVLEANVAIENVSDQKQISNTKYQELIHDFFRTGMHHEKYGVSQLRLVRINLERNLLFAVKKGMRYEYCPDFTELYERFKSAMKSLCCTPEEVIADFECNYPAYRKFENAEEKVARFGQLFLRDEISVKDFDALVYDDLVFVKALDSANKRKKPQKTPGSRFYDLFLDKLLPIVSEARDTVKIFGRMVNDCLDIIDKYLQREEVMRFDDLLIKMEKAVQNSSFREKIQSKYRVMIVDEFQDTDPIQWNIFKTLAKDWDGLLYLVGDPKQSIYGFRNADIYTYLDAANFLGNESRSSLVTNYRSSPKMIKALNRLFDIQSFIPLPRIDSALEYPRVQFSDKVDSFDFNDGMGAVHFMVAKTTEKRWSYDKVLNDMLLPFVTEEIKKFSKGVAILVHTRKQGQTVADFLRRYGISVTVQQSQPISESEAYAALKELLIGIIYPKNDSCLKTMLGGPLIAWNAEQFSQLDQVDVREEVMAVTTQLRECLYNKGFASFFSHLECSVWPGMREPLAAAILKREGGIFLYEDLMHLVELILAQEATTPLTAEGVLSFMEQIKIMEFDEETQIYRISDVKPGAVQVMTMHASKGLEFDIVFALGLASRTLQVDRAVPHQRKKLLEVVDKDDPKYQLYCKELDAEKMRLLYVAMTRAKYRLYVPLIESPHAQPPQEGTASPMEIYLTKIPRELSAFIEEFPTDQVSISILEKFEPKKKNQGYNQIPIKPKKINIPKQEMFVTSFSSLSKGGSDINLSPPKDYNTEEKSIHTLPAGSETGVLLHALLEKLPIKHYQTAEEIAPQLSLYPPYDNWRETIADCLYKALYTPLDGFCLADVDPSQLYREIEFLYPTDNGFMKGVIDLAFSHNGQYYLLDWKSNWLGEDASFYCQENLEEAMQYHGYALQAEIYTEAFSRYLNMASNPCFGGIFYLFLRGSKSFFLPNRSAATIKVE